MNNFKKAFTLVELIIVISIVWFLSTLAFISFQSYVWKTQDTKKVSDLRQITSSLQIKKEVNNFIPLPDNAVEVSWIGWNWSSWILWENVKQQLWLTKIPQDPKFWVNYTFSTFWSKYYEISTMVSRDSYFSSQRSLTQSSYAQDSLIAKVEWNFNGYFIKYNSWGLNYYVSSPSITLSDVENQITPWLSTTNIVIDGESNVPYSYTNVVSSNSQKSFTPQILWSGETCWPTSYYDIKSFVENIQNSFTEIEKQKYKDIISQNFANDIIDFWVHILNTHWSCTIEKPQDIPSVTFLSCNGKDLDFEWYATGEILSQDDCLFDVQWTWNWQVVNGWSSWQKSLRTQFLASQSWSITFSTQITKPLIFSFDYFRNNTNRLLNFYVNNNLVADTNIHTNWTTLSTVPLPPGEYEFRFEFQTDNATKFITLDNLRFEDVWIDLWFEKNTNNKINFTYSGWIPWYFVQNRFTQWISALSSPRDTRQIRDFEITVVTWNDVYFSFDYLTNTPDYLTSNPTHVYVNDLLVHRLWNTSSTWRRDWLFLRKNQQNKIRFSFNGPWSWSFVLLDNFTFEEKQLNLSFDPVAFWEWIDFNVDSDGWRVLSWSLSWNGSYMLNSGRVFNTTKKISFTRTLTQTESIQFFYKTYYATAMFGINNVWYLNASPTDGNTYITKTTPLPPWEYEFYFAARAWWDNTINFDDISFVPTYLNLWFDEVDESQKEDFVFDTPWLIIPWWIDRWNGIGTHYLSSGQLSWNVKTFRITKVLTQPQRVRFDYSNWAARLRLMINGVERFNWYQNSGTFTSDILPPWEYEFLFEASSTYPNPVWIDNLQFIN